MLNIITSKEPSGGYRRKDGKYTNEKPMTDIMLDSLIIAGLTAFAVWNGKLDINACLAVLKATGSAFFIQLAYEKGVKKVK